MDVSIIVPAYNEQYRIGNTLKKIDAYFKKKGCKYEIIVVDDGSTDNTVKVIKSLKNKHIHILKNGINRGKGYSVRAGIMDSENSLVLFSDADLATPVEEFDKMHDEIKKGYDIVIASRNLPESKVLVTRSIYRKIIGKTFPLIVRLLLLRGIKDTQCGFKLLKSDAAKKVVKVQFIPRFAFDVEMLFIARKKGYKIKEVPVRWNDIKGSKVNPIKESFRMLMGIIKIKYYNITERYD
jgi:dolichyl-phosphate beta-glucosyltransferase